MHPRLTAVIEYADRARTELLATVAAVPEPLREARPSEDAWSVAEILEHLMRVEKGVARLVAMKAGEMQSQSEPPRDPDELPELDLSKFALMPDRSRKLTAPERVAPRGEISAAEALEGLVQTRAMLREQLRAADGLALSAAHHPHPVFGVINLYEWVYTTGAHELRHADQIREVAGQLGTH
jgi:DinB superfamily